MLDSQETSSPGLDRALSRSISVNWEMVAWLAIIVLTLVTRLWGLGDRAMSHDESLHTYYSWKLFIGQGYQHDPMMHGPLLYHATALFYLLFGASDYTARLLAVVTGLGLVLSPLAVRKWLGPVGALSTALMLLLSPTVMYYSRYIRHDIPVEFFTAVMVVSLFKYLDTRNGRWIVIAFAAAAGGITSAEMAYINGFILVVFIALALVAERLGPRRADALAAALGAVGLGLLIFATVAATGKLGSVSEHGLPLRNAMHVGFLAGGLGLIYALGTGLVSRFRSDPTPGEVPSMSEDRGELVLADLTAARFFERYTGPDAKGAILPLVSGIVIAAFGYTLGRFALPAGTSADAVGGRLAGSIGGLADLLLILGAIVAAYGLAALLIGFLISLFGKRTNITLTAIGVAAGVLGWAIMATASRVLSGAGDELVEGAAENVESAVAFEQLGLVVVVIGVVLAVYGLLSWVLEEHRSRSFALAVGGIPASLLGTALAVAVVIYALLFTTFFTEPDKLTGLVDSVAYWLEQHEVVRGDQPWYYYGIFLPMYEFLPLVVGLIGAVLYATRPELRVRRGNDSGDPRNPSPAARLYVPLVITWSAGAFWIFSWAGEKMPWLLVHLVVPLTFLAGRAIGDLFAATDWDAMRRRGWQLGGLLVLTVAAVIGWITQRPFSGDTAEQLGQTAGWLLGLPVVALLLWALFRVGARLSRRQAIIAASLTGAVLLLVLNTRYSLMANFQNDELANEYIVYAHGTPDDKLVFEMLQDLQLRKGVDDPLSIAYDNEVSWPFTWYFRDTEWLDVHYVGEQPSGPPNDDVLLVGAPNYSKFEPYLRGNYESIEYRRMWWPNEGYKQITLDTLREGIRDPKAWRNVGRILLYRDYTSDPRAETAESKSLTEWYHHANMRLYFRKDLIPQLWPLVQNRPDLLSQLEDWEEVEPTEIEVEVRYEKGPDDQPLVGPKDLAVAPDGSVYVVDHQNARVVVFDEDGTGREVLAEGELEIAGQAGEPSAWGIGLGPDGEVYIADTWNHRIIKYVDGRRQGEWGIFGQPEPDEALESGELFYGPRDAAIGPDGYVYVTDTGNKRITAFDADGEAVVSYGGEGFDAGQFNEPTSLAFDPETGELYVADLWNRRVQRFDQEMNFVLEWEVDGWDSADPAHKAYLAVGPGGVVAVSDPEASAVFVYDNEGNLLATLDMLQDSLGLDQPVGVAFDKEARIYVAGSNSGVVTRYAPIPAVVEAAGIAEGDEAEGEEAGEEAGEEVGDEAGEEVGDEAGEEVGEEALEDEGAAEGAEEGALGDAESADEGTGEGEDEGAGADEGTGSDEGAGGGDEEGSGGEEPGEQESPGGGDDSGGSSDEGARPTESD